MEDNDAKLLPRKTLSFSSTHGKNAGAGAIGNNLIENLARAGFVTFKIIDYDRAEERNLSTQPYYRSDIGAHKATILANSLYRALGVNIESSVTKLTPNNVKK